MSLKKDGKRSESKKRRGILKSQSRELIVNVRTYFEAEKLKGGPLIPIDKVIERTAAACQISENSVSSLTREKSRSSDETKLVTPGKKRPRGSLIDSCPEEDIRRHIYSYYEREEYPTVRRLVVSLNQAGLFPGSTTTLSYVLKNLGFSWKKLRGNRKLLMERVDLVAWRGRFIRDIFTAPVERIIWLDETWVNSGYSKTQIRTGDTALGSKNAPSGKGSRLILLHAGGIEGFVPNAKLLYRGKKNSWDYHNDISDLIFQEWFKKQLIPNIKPERIIVMDDAPYHCVLTEKYPTIVQRKDEIIAWLKSKNIDFDPEMFKEELLEIVEKHKPRYPTYEIDEIAKEHGHMVLRIPLYHSHFNPIDIIWTKIRTYVAEKSKTFKMSEAKKLIEEKIISTYPQDWEIAVEHTLEVIRAQAALDEIVEERLENMINVPNTLTETEESDYSDEEFSDTEEMEVQEFPPPKRRPTDVQQKTAPAIADEGNGAIDIGKLCKQELVENEEVKEEKESECPRNVYKTLYEALQGHHKTPSIAHSSIDEHGGSIDVGEPCKQEFVAWNEEMDVKKEEESNENLGNFVE